MENSLPSTQPTPQTEVPAQPVVTPAPSTPPVEVVQPPEKILVEDKVKLNMWKVFSGILLVVLLLICGLFYYAWTKKLPIQTPIEQTQDQEQVEANPEKTSDQINPAGGIELTQLETCTNNNLGVAVTLPDSGWICEGNTDEYTMMAKNDRFTLVISSLGRGFACDVSSTDPTSPRYNPGPETCVITDFLTTDVAAYKLYTSSGVDKEIVGVIGDGQMNAGVTFNSPSASKFTEEDALVIKSLLGSLIKTK